MNFKNYIVLTATITPAVGIGNTVRGDPMLRLEEYLSAFEFYCKLPDNLIDGIVLLENSGQNLNVFRKISERRYSKKKFFFIQISRDYPAQYGKGYGEFLMLDQGLQCIRDKGVPGESRIWKITGRLIVENIERIILSAPNKFDLYADFRHVPIFGRYLGGNEWIELRLIAFSLNCYDKYFRKHYGDGYVVEHAFFDRLFPLVRSRPPEIYPRFNTQPRFVGVSGYSNKNYSSIEYKLKTMLRAFLRRVLPNFWV